MVLMELRGLPDVGSLSWFTGGAQGLAKKV